MKQAVCKGIADHEQLNYAMARQLWYDRDNSTLISRLVRLASRSSTSNHRSQASGEKRNAKRITINLVLPRQKLFMHKQKLLG